MARAAAFPILCILLLRAQTPDREVVIRTHAYTPPSTILHAESNLVETGLTVRDSQGRAIGGLHASDFEVLDNTVPQAIAAFSQLRPDAKPSGPPAEPKFVTFFFDDLHMGNFDLPFVKQAARKFIAQGVKPPDRMSIATTSGAGGLDFTTDAKLFAEKLEHLNLHTHVIHSLEEYQGDSGNTLAELGAAARRLSAAPGTRILVLMSSGFVIHVGAEHDVEPEVQKVIDTAVGCNVVVHAIDAKGLTPNPNTWRLNRPLKEIAQGTGGHLFENTNDLAGAMQLAADPEDSATVFEAFGVPRERARTLVGWADEQMARCILTLYRSAVDVGREWGPDFRAIPAPGLVLLPTEDPFLSADGARLAAQRAGVDVVELTGIGHWWMLQDPAQGAAVLTDFWASVS